MQNLHIFLYSTQFYRKKCICINSLRVFKKDSKSAEGNLVGVRPPSRHHRDICSPIYGASLSCARISSRTWDTACCQSIMRQPKVCKSLLQFIREFCGRAAGVGYSVVGIGWMVARRAAGLRRASWRRVSVAKPAQVVSPLPAAW